MCANLNIKYHQKFANRLFSVWTDLDLNVFSQKTVDITYKKRQTIYYHSPLLISPKDGRPSNHFHLEFWAYQPRKDLRPP